MKITSISIIWQLKDFPSTKTTADHKENIDIKTQNSCVILEYDNVWEGFFL